MVIDFSKIVELIKDPDLRIKITNLYGENIDLKEQNHKLRIDLEELKKSLKIKSQLVPKNNHYYLGEDGPFCTKCSDANDKLIRLHDKGTWNGQKHYTCPNCKTSTEIGKYIQPEVGGVDWQI